MTTSVVAPQLTRTEQLDIIYDYTHSDFKGIAGSNWGPEHQGKRSILTMHNGATCLALLESLSEQEILDKLPYALRSRMKHILRDVLIDVGWSKSEGGVLAYKSFRFGESDRPVYASLAHCDAHEQCFLLEGDFYPDNANYSNIATIALPKTASADIVSQLVKQFTDSVDNGVALLTAPRKNVESVMI